MELNWQNFTSEGRIASLFPEAAIKVGLGVSVSAATDKIGLTEDSERLSNTWYDKNIKNELPDTFRGISIQNIMMKYKYTVMISRYDKYTVMISYSIDQKSTVKDKLKWN